MENPHAEKQAILLERIIKNVEKCNELITELNKCVKQISIANEDVNQTADLATRYRKNVQYNLDAMDLLKPNTALDTERR
ncbi:DASH complex subunit Dad4 [Hysterangium stoloniferum]|nr:DASH complex subunit Dad4 [Hysterangium stoloniferum]